MKEITVYEAEFDGKHFEEEEECLRYELQHFLNNGELIFKNLEGFKIMDPREIWQAQFCSIKTEDACDAYRAWLDFECESDFPNMSVGDWFNLNDDMFTFELKTDLIEFSYGWWNMKEVKQVIKELNCLIKNFKD
jgi:hypothetical protein